MANPFVRTSITATANQTVFSVVYTVGGLTVYRNGALLNTANYIATSGSSVTLLQAATAGDLLEFITYADNTNTIVETSISSSNISLVTTTTDVISAAASTPSVITSTVNSPSVITQEPPVIQSVVSETTTSQIISAIETISTIISYIQGPAGPQGPQGPAGTGSGTATNIDDNLTSTSTTNALSANQGRALKALVDAMSLVVSGKVDVSSIGTAASKNVPTSGNATSLQVVLGSDTRLADSRAPLAHNQTMSTITGLDAALATKAAYGTTLAEYGIIDALNTTSNPIVPLSQGKQSIDLITADNTLSLQVLDTFSYINYGGAKYTIFANVGTDSRQICEMLVIHDNFTAWVMEYATMYTIEPFAAFSADVSGANVRLLIGPFVSGVHYKISRTLLSV